MIGCCVVQDEILQICEIQPLVVHAVAVHGVGVHAAARVHQVGQQVQLLFVVRDAPIVVHVKQRRSVQGEIVQVLEILSRKKIFECKKSTSVGFEM
jgi:hypothetical protein